MNDKLPLVSILIPNYNHSKYLDECIKSALDQTYSNTEIIVLDNCSTDNSIQVLKKYNLSNFRVCKNTHNIGNASFQTLSQSFATGDYYILLGADDVIAPTFIENAVSIMLKHPNVGYVHGDRDFIFDDGGTEILNPFFSCSFIASGRSVMPIYMVTTIAHPAQGVIRRTAFDSIEGYEKEIDHLNADRSLWFYLSSVCDYAYIRYKVAKIRISPNTQTALVVKNFQHATLCHLTINDFLRFAEQFGFRKVIERKQEAYSRLAKEFLTYAGSMLIQNEFEKAKEYLLYAKILDDEIDKNDIWVNMSNMEKQQIINKEYLTSVNLTHTAKPRNYDPPEGYIKINLEDYHV